MNGNQTGYRNWHSRRKIVWDEENRIRFIRDGGAVSAYRYDYSGARVLKQHSLGSTAYVNRYYSIRNGVIQTKHVMAGNDRVSSEVLIGRASSIYYYHPDHLGSTNYVTDRKGDVYEHMEYFPFGELWVSERGFGERTSYLYTSKELDEDTQLQYFGARYYDARTSVWQSPDPILGKYLPTGDREADANLPGMGGVFNSKNLGMYSYSHQNPVRFSDPDGNAVWVPVFAIALAVAAIVSPRSIGEKGESSTRANVRQLGIAAAVTFPFTIPKAAPVVLPAAGTGGGAIIASRIGANGKIGEKFLERFGGNPHEFFRTPLGARFVDRFAKKIAHESKVGYTVLSKAKIAIQVAKDAAILKNPRVDQVIWHFFRSPTTGKIGPSLPLRKALEQAGIEIIIHKTK